MRSAGFEALELSNFDSLGRSDFEALAILLLGLASIQSPILEVPVRLPCLVVRFNVLVLRIPNRVCEVWLKFNLKSLHVKYMNTTNV